MSPGTAPARLAPSPSLDQTQVSGWDSGLRAGGEAWGIRSEGVAQTLAVRPPALTPAPLWASVSTAWKWA